MRQFYGSVLPGGSGIGQDRWLSTLNSVAVLDGASSFSPSTATASDYVDLLASALRRRLDDLNVDLPELLAESIREVVGRLDVPAHIGPSSTVLIARKRASVLEVLALGDSTALIATKKGEIHRVTDARLGGVAHDMRRTYRERLQSGSGYDEEHKFLMSKLQEVEVQYRNVPNGYWIAESEPRAAGEAVSRQFPCNLIEWCVLATDGAQRIVDHLEIGWERVANLPKGDLDGFLQRLHDWEETEDRNGVLLPRAKRHDDKTIVIWR